MDQEIGASHIAAVVSAGAIETSFLLFLPSSTNSLAFRLFRLFFNRSMQRRIAKVIFCYVFGRSLAFYWIRIRVAIEVNVVGPDADQINFEAWF